MTSFHIDMFHFKFSGLNTIMYHNISSNPKHVLQLQVNFDWANYKKQAAGISGIQATSPNLPYWCLWSAMQDRTISLNMHNNYNAEQLSELCILAKYWVPLQNRSDMAKTCLEWKNKDWTRRLLEMHRHDRVSIEMVQSRLKSFRWALELHV